MRLTLTDLYEASFLDCSGARLAEVWVDQAHRGRGGSSKSTVVFAFDGNGDLTGLQRAYHTGVATVNLARYRHSLNRLRRTMFAALSNHQPNSEKDTSHDVPRPLPTTATVRR